MTEAHLSDYALDVLRTRAEGAVTSGADHLQSCAECAARMASLAAADASFAAERDLEVLADRALERARPRPPARGRWRWAAGATAAAAAAAASFAMFFVAPDETRTKGEGASVELFVVEEEKPRPMHGSVDPRAELALRLTPEVPVFARVLWAAQDRVVALYPEAPDGAWSISQVEWLPRKIVLDGAREAEWLVVVLCGGPFDHARAVAEMDSPSACDVQSIAVTKR